MLGGTCEVFAEETAWSNITSGVSLIMFLLREMFL